MLNEVLFKFHLIFLVIVFAPAGGILPDVTPETNLTPFLATGGGGGQEII